MLKKDGKKEKEKKERKLMMEKKEEINNNLRCFYFKKGPIYIKYLGIDKKCYVCTHIFYILVNYFLK